jgi:hypothetical protein
VDESGPKRRRRRWALLAGAVPVGLAVAVALSSAAGGGGVLDPVDRPTRPGSSVSGGSPSPGASTDRPVNRPDSGPTRTPDATGTSTVDAGTDEGGTVGSETAADPDDGDTTKSKKPKKSKNP